MRAVVQRVSRAEVRVEAETVGAIGRGLVVLLGIAVGDTPAEAELVAGKIANLRVFPDAAGRMNLSLGDVEGSVLLVSQFTLLGDLRRGRRPSFAAAADRAEAGALTDAVRARLVALGVPVATGRFGARMEVELVNDGPVTIVVDAAEGRISPAV